MCVFWYCRSLQCAPEKWHPLMSLFRVRAPPWVRRPKSSLSLLLLSISSRLTNRSTNLDRLVSVTCGGVITPTTSTRRIFQVLAGRIVATAVILFIQPTLPSLHCLSIQLHLHNFRLHYNICIMLSHNFRNYVYIQDTEDSWFLKSSWQKSYSLKYIFLKNIHQITVKSPLHGVKCRFSLKGQFNPKSTFFVLPAS